MPCPFFLPTQPLVDTGWLRPPRAPLGELFAGECRAGEPAPADHESCNFGYARGNCSRFPADAATPDAVRFSVTSESGSGLRVTYVLEKDHAPVEHGSIEYDSISGQLTGAEGLLEQQARVFVKNHLRR
ncbi:MAG: hypothetical protein ABI995_03685 [Acidobacteriota bacterium]